MMTSKLQRVILRVLGGLMLGVGIVSLAIDFIETRQVSTHGTAFAVSFHSDPTTSILVAVGALICVLSFLRQKDGA